MKVTGIIAEYNPFHNGHQYQIETIKKETGSDYVIVAMSGDFVQRGAPALVDKYVRTKMALLGGADLVLALPALWSVSSAEYFALGGVSLLSSLGIVDYLCYGCETMQPDLFPAISRILLTEPLDYRNLLLKNLKSGLSFPLARSLALEEYIAASKYETPVFSDITPENLHEMLNAPNNILALEYLKAMHRLNSPLTPRPILRTGARHHDTEVHGDICSATYLRDLFLHGETSSNHQFHNYINTASLELLSSYFQKNPPLSENDCSNILDYKLLSQRQQGFANYADCTPALSNRLCNQLDGCSSLSELIGRLNTKNTTYTHLSRVLMHILLDMKQEDYQVYSNQPSPYGRILGFRQSSAPLLHALKSHSSIPLITSLADSIKQMDASSNHLLQLDCFSRDIFRSILRQKGGQLLPNDYQRSPVKINDEINAVR
ncbi:MAG: nucleotidyltransferase family protein [Lachnospiraceae bacterium]